ncbi:MAG: type transport system permease protein [Moorella sp. (in: firmicutes)]|jgi:ABC-type transport system involved in multi-copper enzyme maturation permease subunit|uniref:ABC transporter permease n=1 Tax=unclassified Neomoorella TaxID=2676739 RepID=UPI0010FFB36E|nr:MULTISPECIES: ABC transporter permease [unclassified Moorella (in: firmicutes)]MDK2815591.1 type transport system permease protein [Moorella sp. (in: firmicutes)]GEA15136.1 ABC transporter involved in multi-copper enzyme maturation permease [Moorella sp. E308F]GEA16953.1 ABC transporter involved in multi-copper enzyme maturation permease [Moorella sp. E306M]
MWLMALFTFREAWRKKVAFIAGALTLAFLILYGTGLHFITRDMVNTANPAATAASYFAMMQTVTLFVLGIYLASFLAAGLAVLAAVGSVAGEIENGTLYTLAVRPLSRRDLLLGKFLGLAAMLVTYAALFFLALAGLVYWQTGLVIPGLVPALGLFILEPLVLLAVTMLGTTRLSTLGNGVLAFALYALAVVGGMIEQIGALVESTAAIYTGVVTSLILPADAVYRRLVATVVDRLPVGNGQDIPRFINPQSMLGPFGSQSTPSDWMLLYTLVYIVVLLAAAIYSFKRRDI